MESNKVASTSGVMLQVGDGQFTTGEEKVVTFINRNFEPYRVYHVFVRALPQLLKRPKAHIVMLGGDG